MTALYATSTVPLGKAGAVVMVGPATIVRDMASVAVPFALSVTCTVKLEVPRAAAIGVPLSTPAELNERPAGGDPPITDQV